MKDNLRPDILMVAEMPPVAAFDERFAVHRLWQLPDPEAFYAQFGKQIVGIAGGPRSPIDAGLMDRLPGLEIIASFGAGYEKVDVAAARQRGIVVTTTPDVLTEEVADTAIGLLISSVRQFPQAEKYLREGRWAATGNRFPLTPNSLRGRHVGIVGLGRIGKAIARRCQAMALEVSYWGRSKQADVPYRYYPSLIELATDVDTLIVALPGGRETVSLVSAEVIAALGSNGVFVNIGRGSVVDEPALIRALREGRLAAAGLDVFMNEPAPSADLLALENVVLLPHIGSVSQATWQCMAQLVFDNLKSWFDGEGPITPLRQTLASGHGPRLPSA